MGGGRAGPPPQRPRGGVGSREQGELYASSSGAGGRARRGGPRRAEREEELERLENEYLDDLGGSGEDDRECSFDDDDDFSDYDPDLDEHGPTRGRWPHQEHERRGSIGRVRY